MKVSKRHGGQAIVEFAFILVLLVILVLGIIEFGILFYNKAMITNACREGARAGIVFRSDPISGAYWPLTDAEINTVINTYLQSRLVSFGAVNVSTTINPATRTSGGILDVSVIYSHRFLALPNFQGGGLITNISAKTIMRME